MMRSSRAKVDLSGFIMEVGRVNLNAGNIKKCRRFVGESAANVKDYRGAYICRGGAMAAWEGSPFASSPGEQVIQ